MAQTAALAREPAAARPRRGVLLVVGVVVLALAGMLTVVVLQLSRDAAVDSRRDTALAAARLGVINFVSLDYRSLDSQFKLIERNGTGSFLSDLKSHEAQLRKAYAADQIQSQGKVIDAAVTASSSSEATVVLFIDATLRAKGVTAGVNTRYRARVHMVRSGSRWLIEEVTPVA